MPVPFAPWRQNSEPDADELRARSDAMRPRYFDASLNDSQAWPPPLPILPAYATSDDVERRPRRRARRG